MARPKNVVSCRLATVLVAIAAMTACVSSAPIPTEESTKRAVNAGVAVLRSTEFHFDWFRDVKPVERNLEVCIENAIRDSFVDLQYVSRSLFTKTAFPDLPGESAPIALDSIRVLADDMRFRQRIRELNLRYIIYVGGNTEIHSFRDEWIGFGGGNYAIAAGKSSWSKTTDVSAVIFDFENSANTDVARHSLTGVSWVGGVFPFLILGMPADTEGRACRNLGAEVVNVLIQARSEEKGG